MSSRTPAGVVAILLVAFFTDGARAETVAETLARWGLLGTWATDCSRPPSQANHRLSYVARAGGRAFHERNFGNTRDSREIRAAALRPGGLIEVVADFGALGGVRKWTMIKDADGRIEDSRQQQDRRQRRHHRRRPARRRQRSQDRLADTMPGESEGSARGAPGLASRLTGARI